MRTSEFRVTRLRDTLPPGKMMLGDTAGACAKYWRKAVVTSPAYNPEVETAAAIYLNIRSRIIGHHCIAVGTTDTLLLSPTEVFRTAIVAGAAALVLGHNHPSGDFCPSKADIDITRDLFCVGWLVRIQVLDHIIVGHRRAGRGYSSLREMGYLSDLEGESGGSDQRRELEEVRADTNPEDHPRQRAAGPAVSLLGHFLFKKIEREPIDLQIQLYRALADMLPTVAQRQKAVRLAEALSKAAALRMEFLTGKHSHALRKG